MQGRDSSGCSVSLLNDEPNTSSMDMRRSASTHSSLPSTPHLLRSNSYDSCQYPLSPITPTSLEFDHRQPYPDVYSQKYSMGYDYTDKAAVPTIPVIRPSYGMEHRSYSESSQSTYEEDLSRPAPAERAGKRYPCRFRDSHGCEKTFTTSGHASRHSKIHTAEKAVHCTYQGCHKKFTRADNMKQHLETHFKDRSRSHKSSLTMQAGVKKTSRPTSRTGRPELAARASFEMTDLPLLTRPVAPMRSATSSSGLDALAAAVAFHQ
jgi:hypothetical protein